MSEVIIEIIILKKKNDSRRFLEELKKLQRVKLATLYYDKDILGDRYLNLSNRTVEVKREIRNKPKTELGPIIERNCIRNF